MMLGNLLLLCLLLLQASAAPQPEPKINIMIDINVKGKSISKDGKIKCGIEGPSATRIINGEDVTSPRKYSWQVGLSSKDSQVYDVECGGSIITNKHILTAAHCFPPDIGEKYVIGIGSNKEDDTSIVIQMAKVYIHEDYSHTTKDNDIAIIELSQHFDLLNNGISPICIPKYDGNTYTGLNATVTGWGSTVGYNPNQSPDPEKPNILQEAQVPVLSNTKCEQFHPGEITDQMLCAGDDVGFANGGKDSCQADSGGPLTVQDNGQYQQIGIVSWSYGCASKGNPGVYTRVTEFLGWINKKVAPEKIYTIS